jgi:hypothetical protein
LKETENSSSARQIRTLQTEKASPVTLVFFGYNALWLQQLKKIQLNGTGLYLVLKQGLKVGIPVNGQHVKHNLQHSNTRRLVAHT